MLKIRAPEEDPQAGCKLMDGFGIFIQLLLAAFAFSTLIYKRQREKPQRHIRIWALDVSKQLAGGIIIHSLNVVASVFFGVKPEEGANTNPCVWYFLNILVDTTLGIGILWLILTAFKYLVAKFQLTGFKSGVYGDPPLKDQLTRWAKQLLVYIISLIIMKITVVALFHLCPWIADFGDWVLQWTVGNYKLQVVFVMLIFPLIMNIMQFWVIDTFIKHKTEKDSIRLTRDEEDSQTLLRHDDEEENLDSNTSTRIHIHSDEPSDPPPRYSLGDDEDDDSNSFVNMNRTNNQYLHASSSNDISNHHDNEYELETKK